MRMSAVQKVSFRLSAFLIVPRSQSLFPFIRIVIGSNSFLCHDFSFDCFCDEKFFNFFCSAIIILCKFCLYVFEIFQELLGSCVSAPFFRAGGVVVELFTRYPSAYIACLLFFRWRR